MTDNFARLLALMGGNGGGSTESIQVDTLPTASADELGKIYQYIGSTTENYINGYFYKCVSETDPTTGITTYSWIAIDTQSEDVPHWVGTRAELTAALANDEIQDGTVVLITDEPDVDNLPTEGSYNLVYSNGVWTALQGRLAVEVVDTLPTTAIKTNTIYLVPKFISSTGNIDETNGFFYVRSSINNIPVYYRYIYNTGLYDDTIRSDTSFADFNAIYVAIDNNTFPAGTCNVEIVTGIDKKDAYINLDGTTNGWELIGDEVDDTLSVTSTNPVENRVVANAINKINSFPKVQKISNYNSADTLTMTQAQIDANNGKIIDSVISTSFMLEGVHGIDGTGLEDQVVISVSGLTKDGATTYPYVSFLPDWDIIRVQPYTTTAGDQGTKITIGLKTKFYEPDEVRNLASGSSITRAGGDSYSKDANGDITISIPEKFWHFYATCHYKG